MYQNYISHLMLKLIHFRTFWIQWSDGIVRAGAGPVPGVAEIIQWADPEPLDVQYVSLAAWYNFEGTWSIPQVTGNFSLLLEMIHKCFGNLNILAKCDISHM